MKIKNIDWNLTPAGKVRWQIFGFTAGGMLAICALPITGWIARQPVLMALHLYKDAPNEGNTTTNAFRRSDAFDNNQNAERQEAEYIRTRFASDELLGTAAAYKFGKQIGVSDLEYEGLSNELVTAIATENQLTKIRQKFPNSRAAYAASIANFLYESQSVNNPFTSSHKILVDSETPQNREVMVIAKMQKKLEAVAAQAEKIDPGNAYFTLMLAVVYHALGNTQDEFESVDRALGMSRFDDYRETQCLNLMKLNDLVYGKKSVTKTNGALPDSAKETQVLTGRVEEMVAKAAEQEKEGDWQAGLALRQRALRLSELIRRNYMTMPNPMGRSTSYSAMRGDWSSKELPMIPPPQSPNPTQFENDKNYQMQEARSRQDEKHTQDSYSRYLISKGQLDEAKWASGLSVSPGAYTVSDPKTVALNLFAPTPNENEIQKPWTLLYQILGVIYIFTLAGVVSAVLMYQGRFKIREAPLASASRWGISLGLLASVTLLFPLLTGFQGDIQDQRSVISLFVLLLCGMLYRMLKDSISGFIRTMLYTIGIFLTYAWSAVFICSSLFVSMYANVNLLVLQSMIRLAASAMIVPLMFGMLIAIWARVRKIPVSRGLVRGTGALALPVLTLLMGSYIGTVFVAAHREAKADIMVKRMILDPVFFNDELVRRSKHGNSM